MRTPIYRDLTPPCLRALCLLGCAMLQAGCDSHDRPAAPAALAVAGDASRGQRLLAQFQCGACHQIPGVPGARGQVGPPLSHLARQSYIAGQFANQPALLVRFIVDPPAMQPGTLMPAMGVSEDQARDMAAYLYSLP